MNVKCKCGGRFRRIDIKAINVNGRTMFQDMDGKKATWGCDGCGEIRTQGKRQAKVA